MNFNPVFILVVLAFFLVFYMLTIGEGKPISKRFRSRKRRKVLLCQLSILVLLIATLAVLTWPIQGMNGLLQGVLLSAVVLVPAFVLYALTSLHYRSDNPEAKEATRSESDALNLADQELLADDSKDEKPQPSIVNRTDGFELEDTGNASVDGLSDNMPVIHLAADRDIPDDLGSKQDYLNLESQEIVETASQPPKNVAYLSGVPSGVSSSYHEVDSNSERDVDAQLDRVSQVIQSHDLGQQDIASIPTENNSDLFVNRNSALTPPVGEMASMDGEAADLESIDLGEVSGMLTSLQNDNGRLQKLVIAQHAVIESVRESHHRSKVVARDAIKSMQNAQNNQKIAEKIARREKTARKRIQGEYQVLTDVFENAMSMISENRESSISEDS